MPRTDIRIEPRTGELGDFLRSRRDRVAPESVGVISYGRRRVPGLRREELAQLAGVSLAYLTRLEQGQSHNASDSILDALARALQLDADERAHLFTLARPQPARRARPMRRETPKPGAVQLVHAMTDVPAALFGRLNDVLTWNPLAHRLLAGHLAADAPSAADARPNQLRLLFLDPHTRDLYRDWEAEAAHEVASLRYIAAQFPDDPRIAQLVGEISLNSADFARLWARHSVRLCSSGTKHFHHPEVGDLDLDYEVLHLPDSDGQRILTFTAPPGTASAAGVRLLGAA